MIRQYKNDQKYTVFAYFLGQYTKKFAADLKKVHRTLVCHGTPVEKHCSKDWN